MFTLAIDASRANKDKKTGVENYSFEIIESLKNKIPNNIRVVLYSPEKLKGDLSILPKNWESKILKWTPKRFWTQIRMSLEILFYKPDILFIPAHVFPIIHPKKTIMTIHDIAALDFPESFNFFERCYSIWSSKKALKKLWKIIVPSEFTKVELKKIINNNKELEKVSVVYHGLDKKNILDNLDNTIFEELNLREKYFISLGRLEEKKNTWRIVKAFEKIKNEEKYKNFKLVLIGKKGYGYEKLEKIINNSEYKRDIILTGWLEDSKTYALLKNAEVFIFPSLYEGFGLPVLESFYFEVPSIISKNNSLEEIAKNASLVVNPLDVEDIYKKIIEILENEDLKKDLIQKGKNRLKDFSWNLAGEKTKNILLS